VNNIIKLFVSRHLPYMVKHKVMLDNGVPIVRRSFLLWAPAHEAWGWSLEMVNYFWTSQRWSWVSRIASYIMNTNYCMCWLILPPWFQQPLTITTPCPTYHQLTTVVAHIKESIVVRCSS